MLNSCFGRCRAGVNQVIASISMHCAATQPGMTAPLVIATSVARACPERSDRTAVPDQDRVGDCGSPRLLGSAADGSARSDRIHVTRHSEWSSQSASAGCAVEESRHGPSSEMPRLHFATLRSARHDEAGTRPSCPDLPSDDATALSVVCGPVEASLAGASDRCPALVHGLNGCPRESWGCRSAAPSRISSGL